VLHIARMQIGTFIGHEFTGEIVQVGSNISDFRPGEFVSGEGHVVCGRCRNCLAGAEALVRPHPGSRGGARGHLPTDKLGTPKP
jgi:threonine dehydrogenase-like Zn-dependent dehydrogenase